MSSSLQKSWFLRGQGWDRLGKVTRVVASLGLAFSLFGPLPAAQIAQAKSLEWGDVRPPLTDEADSTDADGFRHLPDFGDALHAITVAPNGDIFAAGTGADVDVNGDGACGAIAPDPLGAPLNATLAASSAIGAAVDSNSGAGAVANAAGDAVAISGCDAGIGVSPVVYRSTDGGMKWRSARVTGAGAGTAIQQIVVSPDYPTDDFVLVVFTDFAGAATSSNGIAYSTDAGLTFGSALTGAGADPDMADVLWNTAALSSNFNYNDGNGEIAIGGVAPAGGPSTATIKTSALKATVVAGTVNDIADPGAAAGDRTVSLAYTYDEEPIALARLVTATAAGRTFGQVLGSNWADYSAAGPNAQELLDDDATSFAAITGNVVFDDEYAAGGVFYASAGAGGAVGGVFQFSGQSWSEKTFVPAGGEPCDTSVDWVSVAGNGSSTRLVASLTGSNMVCRSTNEGSSWSDSNADGGDSVCDACRVTPGLTRISNNRRNPENVYWTTSGNLGGVFKSTSTGSTWLDTGLTNQAYVVGSIDEIDPAKAFATATFNAPGAGVDVDAIFYTDTYGTGAGWTRSLRTSRDDLSLSLPSGFSTHQTAFARFSTATSDSILRTTDGGRTWDNTGADPFDNSPETSETPVASSARSATTYYVGGNKGHVAVTTDGGVTWTILSKDFGEKIDEFDFSSDATTFFVTALDTDTTMKVWQTRDTGATFTQIGDAPWGTGDGSITTNITAYKPADNSGYLLVITGGAVTTDETYRIKIGDSSWTDLDIDVEWRSMLQTAAAGIGDGVMTTLWKSSAPAALFVTFHAFTGDRDDFDPTDAADTERENLLLALPNPPVTTSSVDTGNNAGGYTFQTLAAGRVMELTITSALRGGVTLTQPAANTSVPTNVGDSGTPAVFRWNDIAGADAYEVMIGLDSKLTDGTILDNDTGVVGVQPVTSNLVVVGDDGNNRFPLVQGNTYYWAVRVKMAEGAVFEGPWSAIQSFSVASQGAPTSPQPQLPLDGATMPNLGPTQLSWNNPAGTVQFHIQVLPLNNDGPAIDLIIGDPAQVAAQSYTVMPPVFGQGNYIILPGATYNWRVRTTTLSGSVGVNDSSWGPWSDIRVFKTPRPNAGSIQVQPVTPSANPTISWKDSNTSNFYYEVQLSQDRTFNADPATATAAVYWNLVHGGESNPLNSWTVPSGTTLDKGATYYARVRQRVQATPLGADEPGIGWSPVVSFVVP